MILLHHNLCNKPFGSHLIFIIIQGIYFVRSIPIHVLTARYYEKKISLKTIDIAKTKTNIYFATILADILNISKCSLMTRFISQILKRQPYFLQVPIKYDIYLSDYKITWVR